jgi:hypothetical protein
MWQRLKSLISARFSLRELLLAITAICGLAAAFYVHRPYRQTSFIANFRPQPVLMPAVLARHPTGLSYSSAGGGGFSVDDHSTQEWTLEFQTDQFSPRDLLKLLRGEIETAFKTAKCKVGSTSTANDAFTLEYEGPTANGIVWVFGVREGENIKIHYLAYEHH